MKKFICFIITFLLIFMITSFIASHGTWNVIGPETRSDAYDSLGEHLKNFQFDVEPATIDWEGFDIDGKKYMYFGPFPAMLRILLNKIDISKYGNWSRVSCLIGISLSVLAIFLVINYAIKKNPNLDDNKTNSVLVMMLATFGIILGTPILYLFLSTRIYNEAMLWGVALAIVSLSLYYVLVNEQKYSHKSLAVYGILISFTLLSRITFALPLYALCLYLVYQIFKQKNKWFSKCFVLSFFSCIGAVIQFIYNYKRFHNIFETFPKSMHYWEEVRNFGLFNIHRIYDGLHTMLIPRKENFEATFPYILAKTYSYKNEQLYPDWKEPTVAITLSCVFFSFLILYFLYKNIKGIINDKKDFFKSLNYGNVFCVILLICQCVLISSYCFISERYFAEFVPLIFYLTIIFIRNVKKICVLEIFCILTIFSFLATFLSMISELIYFDNSDYSMSFKTLWLSIKEHML